MSHEDECTNNTYLLYAHDKNHSYTLIASARGYKSEGSQLLPRALANG